jgi:hypothetical protein
MAALLRDPALINYLLTAAYAADAIRSAPLSHIARLTAGLK